MQTVKRWTRVSIECLKRGCVCKGCFYEKFFSSETMKCQAKKAVIELSTALGTPKEYTEPTVIKDYE